MQRLIDDLLTLAREGETAMTPDRVDLSEVVPDSWGTVDTPSASLGLDTDQTLQTDRSRLQQFLENLIRNAVEQGGDSVAITVAELGDGLYVADDGSSIAPDRQEEVFTVGYSTSSEGTGFGLRIVELIATPHEWPVEVTDSASGGPRFEFTGVTGAPTTG